MTAYVARTDHSVDWLLDDQDYDLEKFFAGLGVALIGRKTHDFMVAHGQSSMPGLENYVFSRNPDPPRYEGVQWVSGDPVPLVRSLKEQPGKDIWLVGGSDLARRFFEEGLIDEISLTIMPILLGQGIPLFPKMARETSLKLVDEKTYSSGVVRLRYVPAGRV